MEAKIDKFNLKPGKNCFYSALHNILDYNEANVSEDEIFFLCNGFDCKFIPDESFNKKPHKLLEFIPYQNQINNLSEILHFNKCTIIEEFKQEEFIENTEKAVHKDNFLLLMVKPAVLNYQPLYIDLNYNYHCIVVYGIDRESNVISIGDSYVLNEKGEVNCYKGKLQIDKIKNSIIGYTHVEYSTRFDAVNRPPAIEHNLEKYIKNKEPNQGKLAILSCISYINGYISHGGEYTRLDSYKLIYILKARFLCLIDYLIMMLQKNPSKGKYKMVQMLESLKSDWKSFFIKLMMLEEYKNDMQFVNRIMDSIGNILHKQDVTIAKILKI